MVKITRKKNVYNKYNLTITTIVGCIKLKATIYFVVISIIHGIGSYYIKNVNQTPLWNAAGWSWADKLLLSAVEFQDGVDIVCTPGPGDVQRFSISLSESEQETFTSCSLGRAADRQRYSARADTVSNKFKTVRGRWITFFTF